MFASSSAYKQHVLLQIYTPTNMINVETIFSEILVFRRYQILKTTNLKRILLVFMKKEV